VILPLLDFLAFFLLDFCLKNKIKNIEYIHNKWMRESVHSPVLFSTAKKLCPEAELMNVEVSGHNLETFRLEVSVYNVYTTNQFQTPFAQGEEGGDRE
jgi:hypothetical protein